MEIQRIFFHFKRSDNKTDESVFLILPIFKPKVYKLKVHIVFNTIMLKLVTKFDSHVVQAENPK